MSNLASLRARLKRLEQHAEAGPDEVDHLIRRLPIAVLIELTARSPTPRVQALTEEAALECSNETEFMTRLFERLAAELATSSGKAVSAA